MRWPWQRPTPAAPSTPGAPPRAQTEGPMGWAFLPPIQRTLDTGIVPVSRPGSFPADLPAWRSPGFLGTLSHAVVDAAPGGLIDGDGGGLGAPVTTTPLSPELTLLPPPRPTALQRRTSVPDPGPARDTQHSAEPVVVGSPAVTADADASAGTAADLESDSGAGIAAGIEVTVVPERQAPREPSLVRAPERGMPLLQRAVVTGAHDVRAEPEGPPEAEVETPPASPAPVLAPVVGQPPRDGLPVSPPPVQRTADDGAPLPITRLRLGLGPPLVERPLTAVETPPASTDGPPRAATAGQDGFTEVPIQRAAAPAAVDLPLARPGDTSAGRDPGVGTESGTEAGTEAGTESGTGTEHPVHAGPSEADSSAPAERPAVVDSPVAVDATHEPPPADADEAPLLSLPVQRAVPSSQARAMPTTDPVSTAPALDVVGDTPDSPTPSPPVVAAVSAPAVLPSTPLPLAGGIATSLQRASVLPGPGTPTPSLVVRTERRLARPAPRERVVPVQRIPAGIPLPPAGRPPAAPPPEPPGVVVARATPGEVVHAKPGLELASPPSAGTDPGAEPPGGPPPDLASEAADPGPSPATTPPGPTAATHVSALVVARSTISTSTPTPTGAATPIPTSASTPSAAASSAASVVPVRPAPPQVPLTGTSTTLPLAHRAVEQVAVQAASETAPAAPHLPAPSPLGETAEAAGVVPPVVVQTADAPAPASGAAGSTPAAGGATSAGAAGASATGDVDALAQKLFPAVVRRMKAELLLDRERRGARTDPW